MSFQSRAEFISAQSSEKITLAQVEASKRFVVWAASGSNWTYNSIGVVKKLAVADVELTEVSSVGAVVPGTWHYEPTTNLITMRMSDDSDPNDSELIGTLVLFFSDSTVTASWDLSDSGYHVSYSGRIKDAPGYKHKIGTDQKLVSVIGQGRLRLENTDAELDEVYDTLFFENKEVRIYSWNPYLKFSEAKIIFRGRVTNKTYSSDEVSFTVKDNLFDLQQNVPQDPYTDDDNVSDSIKGRYKRWVYGRVDGLKLQSIDQIGEGYEITGTVSAGVDGATLTGVGTSFLAELSPGDRITIGTQEFNIESVQSDTSATLDSTPRFSFIGQTAILVPDIPVVTKNRDFIVAGHACARLTKTVAKLIQLNRVQLSDVDGILAGDFLTFSTGERIEVKNTAPGNIVVLRQNIVLQPLVGSSVVREPVQQVFLEGVRLGPDKFSITNTPSQTAISLASDAEFDIARVTSLGDTLTFTNGSRTVTGSGGLDLRELLESRQWIRPTDVAYTTFYEILDVQENTVTLRVNFGDPTHTGPAQVKRPNYIGDDSIISADVLGRTVDNTSDGEWITTAAAACLDLLNQINVPAINTASFAQGELDNSELISMAIPETPSGGLVTAKSVIDKLCQSTTSAVTLDPDLQLKFKVLLPEIDPNALEINDADVISWSIQSTNGDNIRNSIIRYRHQDVLRETLSEGNLVQSYSSDFVKNYIGTNKSDELDVYLYNVKSARIMSHRLVYLRSLARADIKVRTDLRLENLEIGNQVILNFDRLYKRLGDKTSRKKVCVVVGKTVTGQEVNFELTDMGNIFNRSSIITPNDAPDYSAASEDERLKYGYITDAQGIVDDDEETGNVNLIS